MLKGVYTFPDLSKIAVYYCPKLSTETSVYVEWMANGLKYTCWLPPKGLRYKG
jgi:hypothetical protein